MFGRIRPRDALSGAELAGLRTPMLFFWAESDTFGGAKVARALARLGLVAQSGHVPWLDAPERAADHVRSFLAA